MSFIKQLCVILALASLSSFACSQTMFKCTQANGKIAFQAEPCPDSSNQQVLKASKRGDVKLVQPQGAKTVDTDAPVPTGARTGGTGNSDAATGSTQTEEARPDAATNAEASVPAQTPEKFKKPGTAVVCVMLLLIGIYIFSFFWLLVIAFTERFAWGMFCLFIPFAHIMFVVLHWSKAKRPFLLNIGSLVLLISAAVSLGHGQTLHPTAS